MIHLGPDAYRWTLSRPDIQWICTAPLAGPPMYPVALDVAESARHASSARLIEAVRASLAPTWRELVDFGLNVPGAPNRQDVIANDESLGRERYLLTALARAVCSLGNGHGVLLRGVHRYDASSSWFARRLIREALFRAMPVALEAPASLVRDSEFASLLAGAEIGGESTDDDENVCNAEALAVAPHGLPARVATQLGIIGVQSQTGPGGERWVAMTTAARACVLRTMSAARRRELHLAVFNAWSPDDWGYLRRMGHAVAAGDRDVLLSQHVPFVAGAAAIGSEFLYRHLHVLAVDGARRSPEPEYTAHAFAGAARTVPRAFGSRASDEAVRCYRLALERVTDPADEAALLYEIATTLALRRTQQGLAEARGLHLKGKAAVERIAEEEARARAEVRWANGLALVEYLERKDDAALALEQHAKQLVARFPMLAPWASPLLNTNTAKLLVNRFHDLDGAETLIRENLSAKEPRVRQNATLDLARVQFDRGDYVDVIDGLAPLLESSAPPLLDENEELLARLLFALSLLACDQQARIDAQLGRMAYLCRILESAVGNRLLDILRGGGACSQRETDANKPSSSVANDPASRRIAPSAPRASASRSNTRSPT